ncbi:Os08g0506350, partial [Oryza sativa Japonica Group]
NPPNLIRAGGGDDGGCGGGGGSSSPPYPVLGDGLGTGWDGMASPAALAGDGSASPSRFASFPPPSSPERHGPPIDPLPSPSLGF